MRGKTGGRGALARLLVWAMALAVLAPTGLGLSLGASAALAQTPMEDQYGGPGVGYAAGAQEPLASAEQLERIGELAGALGGEGGVAALEERLDSSLKGLTAAEAGALLAEMEDAAAGGGTLQDALAGYEAAGGELAGEAPSGEALDVGSPGGRTAGDKTAVGEAPGDDAGGSETSGGEAAGGSPPGDSGAGNDPAASQQPAGEGGSAAEGHNSEGSDEDPMSWEERRQVRGAVNGAVNGIAERARNPHAPGVVAGGRATQPGEYKGTDRRDLDGAANRRAITDSENAAKARGGSIQYEPLDPEGRPRGVKATVTPEMVRDKASGRKGIGSKPVRDTKGRALIDPPGWDKIDDNNRGRGHLLGDQLGGSGAVRENLVSQWQNHSNGAWQSNVENDIADYVKGQNKYAGNGTKTVGYAAKPVYSGDGMVPKGIELTVEHDGDFRINNDGPEGRNHNITVSKPEKFRLEDGSEGWRTKAFIPNTDPEKLPLKRPPSRVSSFVSNVSEAVPASVLKPAGRVAGAVGGPVGDVAAVGAAIMMGEDPGDAAARGAAGAAGGALLGAVGMAACGPGCAFLAGTAGSAAGEAAYDGGKRLLTEYGDDAAGAVGGGIRRAGDFLGL